MSKYGLWGDASNLRVAEFLVDDLCPLLLSPNAERRKLRDAILQESFSSFAQLFHTAHERQELLRTFLRGQFEVLAQNRAIHVSLVSFNDWIEE